MPRRSKSAAPTTILNTAKSTIEAEIAQIQKVLHYWTHGEGKDLPEAPERRTKLEGDIMRIKDKETAINQTIAWNAQSGQGRGFSGNGRHFCRQTVVRGDR